MSGPHHHLLEALGLPPPAVAALGAYLDLLEAWSRRTNLTGARTPAERVRILVEPVVPAAPLVSGRLLDVGSGNGSPGLVLATLCPEVDATLLEPRARRWAFLKEACRVMGRTDVHVLRLRHDQHPGPAAATVSVRALSLPLGALAPLVEPGGRALIFGAAPPEAAGWHREPSPRPADLHVYRRP